jgi:hypothetical protein
MNAPGQKEWVGKFGNSGIHNDIERGYEQKSNFISFLLSTVIRPVDLIPKPV